MKTYKTYKIGTAVLTAVLVLGIGSCAHHRKKPAVPPAPDASASQPKPQATVLEAPKSLEGAWIKVKSHYLKEESVGTETDWWYIKNGESHFYFSEESSEGHPTTPADVGKPQMTPVFSIPVCEDSLGRNYNIGTISYHPRGKTATLRIENCDRKESTLCRSASIDGDFIGDFSKEPAVITFKSAGAGVYHGTIKGIFAPGGMPAGWVQKLETITIYTE